MEIIEWVENWEEREIYWIQYYKNLGFKLTNIAVGGKGSNGHHHSKKWKEQASIRMIGNKNSLGKLHSEEWKLEASKRRSGFNGKTPAYPIYQYDANLNLIHKWNNTKEAADHYGIWNTAIINNLTGVSKSTRVGIFTKELITNQ